MYTAYETRRAVTQDESGRPPIPRRETALPTASYLLIVPSYGAAYCQLGPLGPHDRPRRRDRHPVRPSRPDQPAGHAGAFAAAQGAGRCARHLHRRACRDSAIRTRRPGRSTAKSRRCRRGSSPSTCTAGRDRFNYSEWTTYDTDEQDKLLGGMCSLTKRGRMPLPSYLLIHRDSTLSPADVTAICAWSRKCGILSNERCRVRSSSPPPPRLTPAPTSRRRRP